MEIFRGGNYEKFVTSKILFDTLLLFDVQVTIQYHIIKLQAFFPISLL